jgi:hypothetical protein
MNFREALLKEPNQEPPIGTIIQDVVCGFTLIQRYRITFFCCMKYKDGDFAFNYEEPESFQSHEKIETNIFVYLSKMGYSKDENANLNFCNV